MQQSAQGCIDTCSEEGEKKEKMECSSYHLQGELTRVLKVQYLVDY